jgi:nitrite reductase/ring-hydroxylating ferredoxin subunit/uncharacterized membrane protein
MAENGRAQGGERHRRRKGEDEMANAALTRIADQRALDDIAEPLSEAVVAAFRNAGEIGGAVKDALHGVWLGHPLHPVFTDVPIGAWTTTLALDANAASSGDRSYARAGDFALAVGLAGAVGAAVTGLTDWSETDGRAKRLGLLHGLLNVTATALMTAAYVLRRRRDRSAGQVCTVAGFGVAIASAYLGGDLVYAERIGVTHATTDEPEHFTPVLASSALAEGAMQHVKANGIDLLLVRQDGLVRALAHACAHLGGPLSEGTLNDGSVVCPWHGSEFRLEDGCVMAGPSTHSQPCFAVRERDGQIEVGPGTS